MPATGPRKMTPKQLANLRPVRDAASARDLRMGGLSKQDESVRKALALPEETLDLRRKAPADPPSPEEPPREPEDSSEKGEESAEASGKVTQEEWNLIFTGAAFPGPWRRVYDQQYRALRLQYAEGKRKAQYVLYCRQAAALFTTVSWMYARRAQPSMILAFEARLSDTLSRMQKYTEAERKVVEIQNQAILQIMERVVGVADTILTDEQGRVAFLKELGDMYREQGGAEGLLGLA